MKSDNDDACDVEDPLPDLTRDQRIVLYTLFLCLGEYNSSDVNYEATMGDIDVMKTVIELRRKGLMDLKGDQLQRVTRSYRKNCMVNDIDKDFYTLVASTDSLLSYADVYLSYTSQSRQPTDTSRIPYMRMMMQDCSENLVYFKALLHRCEFSDNVTQFKNFTREWCRKRNMDPIAWADGVSDEALPRFYAAYAFLSGFGNGIDSSLTTQKWCILFSILMSDNYCISVNTSWEEKIRKIQEKFSVLRDYPVFIKEEILLLIQELVDCDQILTSDTQKNTFAFVSEDVRHQVMCHFVLNCLKMEEDLKNYITLSSMDSLLEYVNVRKVCRRTTRKFCLYIPTQVLIKGLGINVILNELRGKRCTMSTQNQQKAVSRTWSIPCDVFNHNLYTRARFLKFLNAFMDQEQCPPCQLGINSILGSFFIDENIDKPRDQKTLHLSLKKWSILITILMSTDYRLRLDTNWKENFEEIRKAFPSLQDDDGDGENEIIKELLDKDLVLKEDKKENCLRFLSDDLRHHVVSYFFKNCLKTHEDYKNYIKLSSVDSLLEYARTWWYKRHSTERCIYLPVKLEKLFVKRLGVDILRHVVLREGIESNTTDHKGLNEFKDKVIKYVRIPYDVLKHDHFTRERFCKFANAFMDRYRFSQKALTCNSLLGAFFTDENTAKQNDQKSFHLSLTKWSILITILMSADYSLFLDTNWKDNLKEIRKAFPTLQDNDRDVENEIIVEELLDKDFLLKDDTKKNYVRFLSDDVRHQVISYFFKNCLNTHKDYKNYIKLSSVDSLLEYVRPWWYNRDSNERCLYLPEKLDELFIKRLGIEILKHIALGERKETPKSRVMRWKYPNDPKGLQEYREDIVRYLNVPREILFWGQEARCRYVDCAKKGTQTIHRARAMIVGCAGAGKTTLLKRLQKLNLEELKQVQSTVGLEVHEDMFEIEKNSSILKAVTEETNKEGRQLLSIMDLGGQCAYYACHQVYLSRRAFYLLAIDMSKEFCQTVNPSVCDQEGTMFADWTYGEYVLFWLKSIHTYCDDDSPVIIVGTHLDNTRGQDSNTLYNNILDHIKDNKHLKKHLRRDRCFVLGFQRNDVAVPDSLSELEKCIASIVREERWKETIPSDWALSEIVLRELRTTKTRMCSVTKLSIKCFGENEDKYSQIGDILKFYHDIGVVLYFNESTLSETVIIDIQWFVDSFKNIIADPNHVRDIAENNRDWLDFYRTGHILDRLLTSIWKSKHFDIILSLWGINQEKTNLLQYMQRLGLIAVSTYAHYIPCMNKRTFGSEEEKCFESIQCKTSVLVFRFNFLPYFFYFRLIVAFLNRPKGEWTVLEDNGLCLYKNVACFLYKEHAVALAVNKSSIQLQVFQPRNTSITKKVTLEVRHTIEQLIKYLLGNFHKAVEMYTVGYQCSKQEVFREHDNCFVEENQIYKKKEITCPRHGMVNHHTLNESSLLFYWKTDVQKEFKDLSASLDGNKDSNLSESELKRNFKTFENLTKIGRDALQIYFDRIFPAVDNLLSDNKEYIQSGTFRFSKEQCALLYPADKSVPPSSTFDVTIMYKLLRNHGPDLTPPTNGWGKKPDMGQNRSTDDVERIRLYRNEVDHKTPTTSVMEKDEFILKWEDLSQAILRLSNGSLKQAIMVLRQQE